MHEQGCTKLWWGNTSLELLHISLQHLSQSPTILWAKPCVANFVVVSHTIVELSIDVLHLCFMHQQVCANLWWEDTSLELLHISLPHFCHTLTQLWAKPCVANFMVVSYTILET